MLKAIDLDMGTSPYFKDIRYLPHLSSCRFTGLVHDQNASDGKPSSLQTFYRIHTDLSPQTLAMITTISVQLSMLVGKMTRFKYRTKMIEQG